MPEASDQKVSLGCGTLILIGIIVLLFGNAKSGDIDERLKKIEQQLDHIEQMLQNTSR